MKGITLTPLQLIKGEKGTVLHALKATDAEFSSFGEAYFSTVNFGTTKGWKRHNRMVMNLVVPEGAIKFIIIDDRGRSLEVFETLLGPTTNYSRLTIEPGLWVAFEGVGEGVNLLLNIASILHDPNETDSLPLDNDQFNYSNWNPSIL